MNPKISYTTLKTPAEKIRFLIKIAHTQFQKNQKLIIFTNDAKSAEYVDHILWSEPKESFLPHFTSQTLLDECIVITAERTNLNQSKIALNLTNDPLEPTGLQLQSILEIEDTSSIEKINIFKKKLLYYRQKNLAIVAN